MTEEAPAPEEIVLLVKCGCERTDAHTQSIPPPEIRLELRLPLSLAHSDDPYENACEDTNTLKI